MSLAAGTRSGFRSPDRWLGLRSIIDAFERATGFASRVRLVTDDGEAVVHDTLASKAPQGQARRQWPIGDGAFLVLELGAGRGHPERALELLGTSLSVVAAGERERAGLRREVAERHEEIALLASISNTLASVIELREAARRFLRDVVRITGAARATLWTLDAEGQELELLANAGDSEPPSRTVRLGDPDSFTAAVFAAQETLFLPADSRPGGGRPGGRQSEGSILSVPVSYQPPEGEAHRLGVLDLLGRADGARFTAGDRRLMTAIASQIGAAIERGRLVEESLRRERIDAELQLAYEMQLKLLPDLGQFRDVAEVAARFEPAESIGGDFYQLVRLSGGRLGVMLGDVSSHGILAALIMALTISAAAIVGREDEPPARVLQRIHAELLRELESTEMYMSLFYGVIDVGRRRLRYANAGHPYAFRISPSGARRLEALDPPLGIRDLESYSQTEAEWSDGDILLLFTDGLSQCIPEERLFADPRLARCAAADSPDGARRVVEVLYEMMEGTEECPPDDRTALAVRMPAPPGLGGEGT